MQFYSSFYSGSTDTKQSAEEMVDSRGTKLKIIQIAPVKGISYNYWYFMQEFELWNHITGQQSVWLLALPHIHINQCHSLFEC